MNPPDTFVGKDLFGDGAIAGAIGNTGTIILRTFGRANDDDQVVSIHPDSLDALAAFVAVAIKRRSDPSPKPDTDPK